jgi:sugar phosphate isomerase/epimerase
LNAFKRRKEELEMLIGAMNHPQHDVLEEIRWMAEMELGFIDLTLEPPAAATWRLDVEKIRRSLEHHRLSVVGHTAYYLPIGHPFESVRQAAVGELRRCVEVFAQVGCRWMNVHPDRHTPMHDYGFAIEQNVRSLGELIEAGKPLGVGVMVENLPSSFNTVEELGDLLGPLPELGLHLDIGHANLHVGRNVTEPILAAFGPRLRHVHLHDNKGGSADLHLPLGAGNLDVPRYVRALKEANYDGTITLEVFSPDRRFLAYSRDVLRQLWNG